MQISLRSFFVIMISSILLVLSGCATKPTSTSPVLDQNKIRNLKNKLMPDRLPVPVESVSRKKLRDTWGASRSQGRTHEGIDIMAPKGAKIYSSTEGIVASLKGNKLGGTVIWIIGPAGSWHYYAHLHRHKRGLKEGDSVRRGDLIGYVGYSGNATKSAPHLHYGIYLQGKGRGAINPYPYLK